jgi:hypothetical protein
LKRHPENSRTLQVVSADPAQFIMNVRKALGLKV